MVLEMKFVMEKYAADTFLPYLGQVFNFESVDVAAQRVQLELSEVRRQESSGRPNGFREPFALVFTASGGALSTSALLRLMHDDFEAADWFLTRVMVPDRDPRLAYYEAVFG
jgi:hypothetical protein